MQASTKYFEKPGPVNTAEAVNTALERARELKIKHLVIASNSGSTVEMCINQGFDLTWVTHHVGFSGPGVDEVSTDMRSKLQAQGVKVLTTTHLMAGIDRALRLKGGGLYPAEIVGHTLRMFGQGVKVAIECTVMSLDSGLIPFGETVLALGGTGRGADSAVILKPAHSSQIFDTKIIEICCKPRLDN
jgi:uncharacterized protein